MHGRALEYAAPGALELAIHAKCSIGKAVSARHTPSSVARSSFTAGSSISGVQTGGGGTPIFPPAKERQPHASEANRRAGQIRGHNFRRRQPALRLVMTAPLCSDPKHLAWIASSSAPGAAVSSARHACQLSTAQPRSSSSHRPSA